MFLFSDYDYTFKEHDNPDCDVVYAKNLAAVKKWRNSGNLFGVATGRGEASLRTQFPNFEEYCDYVVLNNGARVIDKDCNTIYADKFSEKNAVALSRLLGEFRYGGKHAIISFESDIETPIISTNTSCARIWFESLPDCDRIEELILKSFTEFDVFTIRKAEFLDDDRLPWVKPDMQHFIEVSLADTNKGSGIKKLARKLGIEHDDIITIGDDTNDIVMIEEYRGYAIESGTRSVLSRLPKTHIVSNVYELITQKLSS